MLTAETIDRIIRLRGDGLPITSIYVDVRSEPGAVVSKVSNMLHEVKPLAEDDDLDREARLSVRDDLDRIENEIRRGDWRNSTAVAMFSCSGRDLFEQVELPRHVADRVVVDATPWVRPVLSVLDEYHRALVVVTTRREARLWVLYQEEVEELEKVRDPVTPELDDHRDEELDRRHFRRVVGTVHDLWRAEDFEILVLGGVHEEIGGLVQFLPKELENKIAGEFHVDLDRATDASVRMEAGRILERYEREQERTQVAEVLEKHATGGFAAVGLRDCLWAGATAAVDLLLVQEDVMTPGMVCDENHWLATEGADCPLCGRRLRRTPDVLDELVETVVNEAGSVKHVRADTPLREHVVAAHLRFPLPPLP
jgi:peptide chain release factor subunit 1